MASTLLEQARATHEENERLERQAVKDLQQSVSSHREKLFQSHRIKNVVDAIVANSARLAEIYADADGARRDEIAALGGQGTPNPSATVFTSFYERLNEIREYHRRHPGARVVEGEADVDELIKDEPWVQFSGEEALGKHVDMNEAHQQFCNAKFGRSMDYASFLDQLPQTHKIPRNFKFTKAYRLYMGGVAEYLESFFLRTHPLQDLPTLYRKLEEDFADRWEQGQVLGWEDQGLGWAGVLRGEGEGGEGEEEGGEGGEGYGMKQGVVDLSQFDTVDELLDADLVPPAKVKEALGALGLKTGGTPRERAERLLMAKTTRFEAIDPKHFAKAFAPPKKKGGKASKGNASAAADSTNGGGSGGGGAGSVAREVAVVEAKVQRLCELLEAPIAETRVHVEKKAGLTYEEMAAEREEVRDEGEEVVEEEEESEEEEEEIYNPLKLPMGWDGKPIPYWLYKLHGLNQVRAQPGAGSTRCGLNQVRAQPGAGSTRCGLYQVRSSGPFLQNQSPSGAHSVCSLSCPSPHPLCSAMIPGLLWPPLPPSPSQEFKCEICGNYSYWGRRAFERHFREFRHQHGMRCLGVPNTKAFHEVTVIKDALALWERMREKQGGSKWRPEVEEECEDREGNVYDRKTFQDLRRQGII
ncbi:unnamed protein product [Closterium sp. Naga37s-1]|nr:unnamed protein product [Closterium sp. Naga37s-1]